MTVCIEPVITIASRSAETRIIERVVGTNAGFLCKWLVENNLSGLFRLGKMAMTGLGNGFEHKGAGRAGLDGHEGVLRVGYRVK